METAEVELSVLIPTRNRPDTLRYSIQSVIRLCDVKFELVIADNSSNSLTAQIVETFNDPRIKYLPPVGDLSMSRNWERAVNSAEGRFITILGDDDALNAAYVGSVLKWIEVFEVDAVVWSKAEFGWPDHPDEDFAGVLAYRNGPFELQVRRSSILFALARHMRRSYTELICPYSAIVRRDLFDKVRTSSSTSRVFAGASPDISSALALTSLSQSYLYTNFPVSINGASAASNGTQFIRSWLEPGAEHRDFLRLSGHSRHRCLDRLPSVLFAFADDYLSVRDDLKVRRFRSFRWRTYIRRLCEEARSSPYRDILLDGAKRTAECRHIRPSLLQRHMSPSITRVSKQTTLRRVGLRDVYEASTQLEAAIASQFGENLSDMKLRVIPAPAPWRSGPFAFKTFAKAFVFRLLVGRSFAIS